MNIKHNRTKILATVGPAITDRDMMISLIEAGVNVFRLNFSHGTEEQHFAMINQIAEINKEFDSNVGVLADLQGPKIRIGHVKDNARELEEGEIVKFSTITDDPETGVLFMSYENFAKDVGAGDRVLIDDGKLELEVTSTDNTSEVSAKVIYGGMLSSKKGVNLPNTRISVPSLTPKDKSDLRFLMECGCDVQWIALSFVRKADDLTELRGIINYYNKSTKIIAKIERPEAMLEIDEIIEATDAIMIARGDLGVEMPMEQIPMIQKRITKKCQLAQKPVVIATQMMESMITSSRPTRAEATDVANG
ncbi:MAG: pyruvate kinase, partial [Limisphaerales bacterium]